MSRTTLYAGLASASATAVVMPHVIRLLRQRDRLDVPNARSSHIAPTPRGGGLACLVGLGTGLLIARSSGVQLSSGVGAGTVVLSTVGLLDDEYHLPALHRLVIQAAAGATVGAAFGGRSTPYVGVVMVPAIVNSFNFMDGINGISGGQISVWSAFAAPRLESVGLAGGAALAHSMLGAAVGFLPWNLPHARVFLGDVGSYLFGAGIAFSTLECWSKSKYEAIQLLAPYSVYLADTGWTILGRAVRGEPLAQAHREHVYQQLVDLPTIQHWHVSAYASGMSALCALIAGKIGVFASIGVAVAYLATPRCAERILRRLRED